MVNEECVNMYGTAAALERLPDKHRKTYDSYRKMLRFHTEWNNRHYYDRDLNQLSGYLLALKDAGIISQSDFRCLKAYATTFIS